MLTHDGGIVEIQGTAEQAPFSEAQFHELMRLARGGTGALFAAQRQALSQALAAMPEAGAPRAQDDA